MDVKSLLDRTKEIKMPKEMGKRIMENVLNLSNSFSDQVQKGNRMANKEVEKVRKNI